MDAENAQSGADEHTDQVKSDIGQAEPAAEQEHDQQQQQQDQQQEQQQQQQYDPQFEQESASAGYKIDPSLSSIAGEVETGAEQDTSAAATSGQDASGLGAGTGGGSAGVTTTGRYNPYPLPFHPQVAKDIDASSDGSSHLGTPATPSAQHVAGGPIRTHHHHHNHTPAGSTPVPARGGRHSVMLGNDGRPIPDHERPPVGTEEYANMRRVNHKEVEKKRRETINDGINALAGQLQKEYTTSEKNKGAILHKAAQYIEQLKQNEAINIERWTLEKLLCDQSIAELQQKCDHLQKEHDRAWKEC